MNIIKFNIDNLQLFNSDEEVEKVVEKEFVTPDDFNKPAETIEDADLSEEVDDTDDEIVFEDNDKVETLKKDDGLSEEKLPEETSKANKAFAELRIEKARLKKEQDERDKWYAEKYADYGVTDEKSYREKYEEQLAQERQNELKEKADNGDIEATKELMLEVFKNTPEYRAMAEINQKSIDAEYQAKVDTQCNEFIEEYGDLIDIDFTSTTDLAELPNGDKILEQINKGLTLSEAFLVSNRDLIVGSENAKVKQKVLNNQNAKAKLKTLGSKTSKTNTVTYDRDLFEGMWETGNYATKAEVRAAYARIYIKKT